MTQNLHKSVLVEMLKEQLVEKHSALAETLKQEKMWVVFVSEEMTAPEVKGFDDEESLSKHLRRRVKKHGNLYVFKGQRCSLGIGSLPVLYGPDSIIPLFSVDPPVFTDDGSTHVPIEYVIPTSPRDEVNTDETDNATG